MSLLNKIRPQSDHQRSEQARQKVILYKKVFMSPEGREVLLDLCDKHHMVNTHNGDMFKEGQRSVVLEIFKKVNIDMVQFDKLLKGEIS